VSSSSSSNTTTLGTLAVRHSPRTAATTDGTPSSMYNTSLVVPVVEPAWWCESRVGQAVVGPVGVRGYPAARDRSHEKTERTPLAHTHARSHTHSHTKSLSVDGRRPHTRVKNDTSAHAHTITAGGLLNERKKCQCDFSRVPFSTKLYYHLHHSSTHIIRYRVRVLYYYNIIRRRV